MKVFKLFIVVCLVLFVSSMMIEARTYITGINFDVTFTEPYPARANDFHIKASVLSRNNVMPRLRTHWNYDYSNHVQWGMTGMSLTQSTTDPNRWDFTADYRTDNGLFVFNGATCHFGVEFLTEYYNTIRITEAYWTYNGRNVGNATIPGFHSWERPYGPVIVLSNDTAIAADVANLQFAVTTAPIPLADMSRNAIGLPGTASIMSATSSTISTQAYSDIKWVSYPDKIRIEPKSSVEINLSTLGIKLGEGQFLQGRFINPATGDGTWLQHQHTIEIE